MPTEDFKDIAPYEGQDYEDAIQRLVQYPQLLNNFTDIISRHNRIVNKWKSFHAKGLLAKLLPMTHSYTDFQELITCNLFLEMIESSSIDEFTFGGLDFPDDRPHIYISNHRDIVLDTALLDLALFRSGKQMCEMVIGDNLLVNQFTTDMFKVNGAVTVKRNFNSTAELREGTLHLSKYLKHAVLDKKKSLWIAQKSGRSKDGNDNTSPAIIKMLYLAYRDEGISFSEFLDMVSIVPVSISYQYDPCDVTKSEQEIRKLKAEGAYNVYVKKKYADVLDLVRGLRLPKGNVHLQAGNPIDSSAGDVRGVVANLDRQIHLNYRLWDTNYYSYDKINGSSSFAQEYKDMSTKSFDRHYKALKPEVSEHVFRSYANPVFSMLAEKAKEENA